MNTLALKSSIRIVNIIIIFLFISMIFLMSSTYYFAYAFNAFLKIEFFDIGLEGPITGNMRIMKQVFLLVIHFLAIYTFWKIRGILYKIRKEGPFLESVTRELQKLFIVILAIIGLNFLSDLMLAWMVGQYQIEVNFSLLITIFLFCAVYVMIEMYSYGVKMHHEQKLTI